MRKLVCGAQKCIGVAGAALQITQITQIILIPPRVLGIRQLRGMRRILPLKFELVLPIPHGVRDAGCPIATIPATSLGSRCPSRVLGLGCPPELSPTWQNAPAAPRIPSPK